MIISHRTIHNSKFTPLFYSAVLTLVDYNRIDSVKLKLKL